MSAFTPDEGTLYYVASKIICTRGGAMDSMFAGVAIAETKFRDRSYQDRVLRCVARDDRMVVGDIVHGSAYGSKRLMLLREEWDMFPVGPDVAAALGLTCEAEPIAGPSTQSETR